MDGNWALRVLCPVLDSINQNQKLGILYGTKGFRYNISIYRMKVRKNLNYSSIHTNEKPIV